jgi:hypothetical protein
LKLSIRKYRWECEATHKWVQVAVADAGLSILAQKLMPNCRRKTDTPRVKNADEGVSQQVGRYILHLRLGECTKFPTRKQGRIWKSLVNARVLGKIVAV